MRACVLKCYPPSTQQKPCQFLRPNLIQKVCVSTCNLRQNCVLKTPCKNYMSSFQSFQNSMLTHVEFQFSIDMSVHVQYMFHRSCDCFSVHWRRHLLKILLSHPPNPVLLVPWGVRIGHRSQRLALSVR